MTDIGLFAMGCGVSFVALAGAYAFLRERFLEGTRRESVKIHEQRGHDAAQQRRDAGRPA